MVKKLLFVTFSLFLLASCARTHGEFLSEHKEGWFNGNPSFLGFGQIFADKGFLYCRANTKEEGLADPVCFKSRFEKYEDEKPRVDSAKGLEETKKAK